MIKGRFSDFKIKTLILITAIRNIYIEITGKYYK